MTMYTVSELKWRQSSNRFNYSVTTTTATSI